MNESNHEQGMREKTEALISLNKLELCVGLIVALIAIGSFVGSWYILPYRMERAEIGISELRDELHRVQESAQRNNELLVRIDERLRQVQRALKIPSDDHHQQIIKP